MQKITLWLDKASHATLIILVTLLPIAFIPVLWITLPHAKISLIAICSGIGMALFVCARFIEGPLFFPKSWIVLSGVLLPVAYVLSALWVGTERTSFLGAGVEPDTVATIFLWFTILLLAALAFRTRPQLIRLEQMLILGAGLVILFHLARLVFGAGSITFGGIFTDPAASVVGSWHDLAIFLGLIVFLSATFLTSAIQHTGGMFAWLVRGVVISALALLVVINMIDVWVGLTVLSAIAIGYLFFYEKQSEKQKGSVTTFNALIRKSAPLVLIFTLALIFSFVGRSIHEMLPEPVRISHVEVRPSWGGTFEVASRLFEGTGSLFGSGPNTFTRQWGLYKPAGVNETAFWNADFSQGVGLVPTALVTVGILGLLAWIFFFVTIVYEAFRTVIKSPRDVQPIVVSLTFGAFYLWTFTVMYHPGVSMVALAFLLTGTLVGWGIHTGAIGSYIQTTREANAKGFILSVVLVVLAVLSLGVSALVLRTITSDIMVNRGVVIYNTSSNIALAQTYVERALFIDNKNERAHRAALELAMLQAASLIASKDPNASVLREQLIKAISSAIQHGLTAVSFDSADYQNWVALARVYEQLVGVQVEGAYKNAEQAYKNAIQKNPTNPLFHLRLAQLAVAQNDLASAEQHLIQAITLKPNFAAALFLASQVAISKKDVQGALLTANAAAQSAPEEPVAWFQLGVLLFQAGRADEALLALERSVTLNGNYANAMYVLGLTYSALNRYEEALLAMERVLALNPGNEEVKKVIKQIKERQSKTTEKSETQKQKSNTISN